MSTNEDPATIFREGSRVVGLGLSRNRFDLLPKGTHCATVNCVKYFAWDPEKNEKLKMERGISFEEIVFHVERGDILDILEHPNQEKYEGQRVFVIEIEGYAYLVPYIETENEVVLKTVIPSRKATRKYLGRGV